MPTKYIVGMLVFSLVVMAAVARFCALHENPFDVG